MELLAASLSQRADEYLRFYHRYALDAWDNLTPMQYGSLLIGIAVFGWILMKSTIIK